MSHSWDCVAVEAETSGQPYLEDVTQFPAWLITKQFRGQFRRNLLRYKHTVQRHGPNPCF